MKKIKIRPSKAKNKPIRVTTVLSFVNSTWKEYWWKSIGFEKADKITKESAEFGTRVHKLVEQTLIGNIELDIESDRPEEQCATAIVFWIGKNKVQPAINNSWNESTEVEVRNDKLDLIGHFDALVEINNKRYIVDFKTSGRIRKEFPLQKSAYAKMCDYKVDDGITIRSHWDKEKNKVQFQVKEYNNLMKDYWPKFKACLDVYKYFNGRD